MRVCCSFDDPLAYRGGFVSIGNFDGVHLGHQSMIAALVRHARAEKVPAVVFTFDPHPVTILRPQQSPPPLTTTERKLQLLEQVGVDCTIVYPTDRKLLDLTARQFFEQIVLTELASKGLVEGPNFFFGHQRAGTIDTLREYCQSAGLQLEIVPPVEIAGRLVSSTEIRGEILAGRMPEAAQLLGHPYRVVGEVVRGAERGRTLGFPTANLHNVRTVLPSDGVYAGRAFCADGKIQTAAINLGPNPTFGEQQRKLEVHLVDFSGDLYGQQLDVEFLQRLRDTRPFAGVEQLKAQLARDVEQARALANDLASG